MSEKREKPLIIPLFIPYQGCPYRCIFCKQEKITSQAVHNPDANFIRRTLNQALASKRNQKIRKREVAFFGGTFTNLPIPKMQELLVTIEPYLKNGSFHSVRVSTRPDAIDDERLELMRRLGVTTVELGAQSMDDHVLEETKRGHSSRHIMESFRMLRDYGFNVGIQLMPGLPGDSYERFMKSIDLVLEMKPDMVRLYPTIVIKGTELASMYRQNMYKPLSLEEAKDICVESCIRLESRNIPVIRIGLMSSPSLLKDGEIIAGPWHSAFGFLVRSEIHQKKIQPFLPVKGQLSRMGLRAPEREIPLIRGYKNTGLEKIREKTGTEIKYLKPDNSISSGHICVDSLP